MKRISLWFIFVVPFLLLNSCAKNNRKIQPIVFDVSSVLHTVSITELCHTKGFKLMVESGHSSDAVLFRYQAYHLDTGDINKDGRTDILLGLIKPTKFDPELNKRLFILRVDEGTIRPLWLGSKTCNNLQEFRTLN